MAEAPSKTEILLARTAVALLLGFAVADILWYGLSTDELERLWRNIAARPGGPMTFRFVLQPTMAIIVALARRREGRAARPHALSIRDPAWRREARRPSVGRRAVHRQDPDPRSRHGRRLSARLSGFLSSGRVGGDRDIARVPSLCAAPGAGRALDSRLDRPTRSGPSEKLGLHAHRRITPTLVLLTPRPEPSSRPGASLSQCRSPERLQNP